MELILSFLALCVAMSALWLSSTISKRSEEEASAFLLRARKEIKTSLSTINHHLNEMESNINSLGGTVSDLNSRSSKNKGNVDTLRSDIEALRGDLSALDESIPKQYRKQPPRRASPHAHH